MNLQILTFIPAILAIIWAVIANAKNKSGIDAFIQAACGIALILNGLIMYQIISGYPVPMAVHAIQAVGSSTVVPLTYMFFARQIGRAWNNATTILIWIQLLWLLLPNVCIFFGTTPQQLPEGACEPMKIAIINDGIVMHKIHTADLLILIQAVLTAIRIIPMAQTMKKYGLRFAPQTRYFIMWWLLAILFIAVTSLIDTPTLTQPINSWIYFASYAFLITSIYVTLARNFKLKPVLTEEDEAVEIDQFIQANQNLADHMRTLFVEEKVYLQPGITIDQVATQLGTNRTYFTRMMRAEFGMSFKEYINQERIRHSQRLLLNTDYSLEEIAMECGFADQSSFGRTFKLLTDTTPISWKTMHKPHPETVEE